MNNDGLLTNHLTRGIRICWCNERGQFVWLQHPPYYKERHKGDRIPNLIATPSEKLDKHIFFSKSKCLR